MTLLDFIQQAICERLCDKPAPVPEPHPFTVLQQRSGQHVRNTLQRQFPGAGIRIKIADAEYSAPALDEFNAWLEEDQLNTRVYHPDWFDCDDFARALRCKMFKIGQGYQTSLTIAYCEGHAPDGYHAYNLLIDNTDAIYIIEPQSDHVVPVAESKYRTDFIQL